VIVAMIAVRMVQASVDKVIDVISVRHSLVTASWPMLMCRLVPACSVFGRAAVGIIGGDLQDMLLDALAFHVMQVSVLEIVHVIFVPNRDVSAARAMFVWAISARLVGW
jgi:hypothetical protein